MTKDVLEATWKRYQDAWSDVSAEEREGLLQGSVAEGCTFRSPGSEGAGLKELTEEIARFQEQYPGAYFKTHKMIEHHGLALSEWTMYGKDGAEFLPGKSYARFGEDGLLVELAGFWEL